VLLNSQVYITFIYIPLPTFNSDELVKLHGKIQKISLTLFVKAGRYNFIPSICVSFINVGLRFSIKNLNFSFFGQIFQYCLLGLKACRLRFTSPSTQTFNWDNLPLPFPNYQNIVNVPQGQQKDKNDLIILTIRQKYPYKFKKRMPDVALVGSYL